MHLQSTNPLVREYLRDRRTELFWIRDYLVSTMENEKIQVPSVVEDTGAVVIALPDKNNSVELEDLYRSLCELIKLGGTGTSDKGEVLELLRKMEVLEGELRVSRKENDKLKTSMEALILWCKKTIPEPPPENIDLSMISDARFGWTKDKSPGDSKEKPIGVPSDSQETGDPIYGPEDNPKKENSEELKLITYPQTGAVVPKLPSTPSPSAVPYSAEPSDLSTRMDNLSEIFPHLAREVLKIALKNNGWNNDSTAMALFDPDKEAKYYEEAMK